MDTETSSTPIEIDGGTWFGDIDLAHAPISIETDDDRRSGNPDDWGVTYEACVTCTCGEKFRASDGVPAFVVDDAAEKWLTHVGEHDSAQRSFQSTDKISEAGSTCWSNIAIYIEQD